MARHAVLDIELEKIQLIMITRLEMIFQLMDQPLITFIPMMVLNIALLSVSQFIKTQNQRLRFLLPL
jgi:hypothetical protein